MERERSLHRPFRLTAAALCWLLAASAWASPDVLVVSSAGEWSFRGHVRNYGLQPRDYAFTATLSWTDAHGAHELVRHLGRLLGTDGAPGSDFEERGANAAIAVHWAEIVRSSARFSLRVSVGRAGLQPRRVPLI